MKKKKSNFLIFVFSGHDLWLPDQNRSGKIRLVVLGVLENFGDENNNQKEFLIDPNDPKNEISMEWIFLKSQLSWCLDRNATFKIKVRAKKIQLGIQQTINL